MAGLTQASSAIGLLLLDFANCFLSSRLGWLEDADDYCLACLDRAARLLRTSWLQAIIWWRAWSARVRAERTTSVLQSAKKVAAEARIKEHVQLEELALSFTQQPSQ